MSSRMSSKLNHHNFKPTNYDDFVVPSSVSGGKAADDCPDDVETSVPEGTSEENLSDMVKSYTCNGYEVKLERDPTNPERVLRIVAKRLPKDAEPSDTPVLVRSNAVDITNSCSSCKKKKSIKEFTKHDDVLKKYKTCTTCRVKTSRSDSKKLEKLPTIEEEKEEVKADGSPKRKRSSDSKKGGRKKQKTPKKATKDLLTDPDKNFSFIKGETPIADSEPPAPESVSA